MDDHPNALARSTPDLLLNKSTLRLHTLGVLIAAVALSGCGGGSNTNSPDTAVPTGKNNPIQPVLSDYQDAVAITSVNGNYDTHHAAILRVHPGDVITFAADLLSTKNNNQPDYAGVERFMWSATDANAPNSAEVCDPNSPADCLLTSNFQVNDYGVAYYASATMPRQVEIKVRNRFDDSNFDSINLINVDFETAPATAPVIVTDIENYPQQNGLDPSLALNGQGHWVYLNDKRYFVPYTYATDDDAEWAPYHHGYWTQESSTKDMHWVSYDPWGWMTDHYGYWRYHSVYGWIWAPFEGNEFVYHANTVTWFDDGAGYVGWYPYANFYSQGYLDGEIYGFSDGFWLGLQVGSEYNTSHFTFQPGFTVIAYEHFRDKNIAPFYEHFNANGAPSAHLVAAIEHSNQNRGFYAAPRTEVVARLGTITEATFVRDQNGSIRGVKRMNPVPAPYSQVVATFGTHVKIPLAGRVDARNRGTTNGHASIIEPTTNGRGIVHSPLGRDNHGQLVTLPAQTSKPAVRNPGFPAHSQTNTPNTPVNQRPTLPNPVPPRPRPQPSNPPTPGPAPRPSASPTPSRPRPHTPPPVPHRPALPPMPHHN